MAGTVNKLEMAFRTSDDKNRVLTISPCKVNVTEANIRDLAASLIDSEVMIWNPEELLGARLRQVMTVEII